jgi:hypothetical protein
VLNAYLTPLHSAAWLIIEGFCPDCWSPKIAPAGEKESIVEFLELEMWKMRHAELVKQAEMARLLKLAQGQPPPAYLRLRLWMGDRLIALGNRLKAGYAITHHAAGMGGP